MTLEEALAELEAIKARLAESTTALAAAKKDAKGGKVAEAEIATLRAELDTMKAAAAEQATKGAMAAIGITDADDQDIVLYKYGKVAADEEGNKPALDAWLTAERKAKAGWLSKLAPPPTKTTTKAPAKVEPVAEVAPAVEPAPVVVAPVVVPAKSPDAAASRAVVPAAPSTGQFTAEQIRAMSPAQYKQMRARVSQETGIPLGGV